ncbi:hypothetical protein BDV12DRAFT_184391 [Aspergillus spectabilis]
MEKDLSIYRPGGLLYTQERLSKYKPAGYHPVSLGDSFMNGRYQIHLKLGFGSFSSLACQGHRIKTADTSQESDQFWEKLIREYIINLLDSFTHGGPNGLHQCLVFELLDISGANIAFTCSHLLDASEEDIFDILGSPEIEELAPTGWDEWVDEDKEDIRILDFGEAFLQGREPKKLAQPGNLQVPETILADCGYTNTSIQIYMLIFRIYPVRYLGNNEVLAAQMIGFVEELPMEWQGKWEFLKSKLKYEYEPRNVGVRRCQLSELERKFKERVNGPELARLLVATSGLMRSLPERRMGASQARGVLREGRERGKICTRDYLFYLRF